MAYNFRGDVEITRGLGVASMTTLERVAYTPAASGYTVYDSDLKSLYTWNGIAWFSGKDRVHADDTTVAPATAVSPTLGEIQTFVTTGAITDTLVYYTGDDVPASGTTHAYYVDGSGVATTMIEPGSNSIEAWAASTAYLLDAIVTTPSGALVSKIAGGSTGVAPYDTAEAVLWDLVQNGPHLPAYPGAGVYIYAGQTMYDATTAILYQRTASGDTASVTFDATEQAFWTRISAHDDLAAWTASTDYTTGHHVVSPSGALLVAGSDFTSETAFDGIEGAKWAYIGQVETKPFAPSTYYYGGEKAIESGRTIIHGAAGTSAVSFTELEAANWTYESQNNIGVFAASTVVLANELMVDANVLYQRTATGTTGATFDDTEEALWTRITAKGATNRTHVTDTAVGPVITGRPTLAEVQAVIDAANVTDAGSFVDTLTYYTGDDLPASTATYVYWTDNAGIATSVEEPHVLNNFVATVAPVTTDDSAAGYSTGSHWYNTNASTVYICTDSTAGAAVWELLNSLKHNFGAIVDPTTAADLATGGYEVASLWFNTVTTNLFVCTSSATAAATWEQVNSLVNNFAATAAPIAATDDVTLGYEVGSRWIDITNDNAYVCVDATDAAAVWLKMGTGSNIDDWTATTDYDAGQVVKTSTGSLVTAIATFTSGATFVDTNWTWLGQVETKPFAPSTYYYGGEKAIESGRTIIHGAAGTSAASFTESEAANWTYISQDTIGVYPASTVVLANEIIVDNTTLWQRTANGTTTATFDATEKALWTQITATSVFESIFLSATWGVAAAGYYTITIPAATHGITEPKIVQVYENITGDFDLVQVDRQRILANGDVEIRVTETPDGSFSGRIEIS